MRSILKFAIPLVAGLLALAGASMTSVSAAGPSASQNTTLSATVGSTLTLTGLASSYSAVAPAGITTDVPMGPISVSENGAGYQLILSATSASFAGSGANSFPLADDGITSVCSNGHGSATSAPLTTAGVQVGFASGAASDTCTIHNGLAIPAGQAADTYSAAMTLLALGS